MKFGKKSVAAAALIIAALMLLVPLVQADIFAGGGTQQQETGGDSVLPDNTLTLDLKNGSVIISAEGYDQGSGMQPYTGAYEIVSSDGETANTLAVQGGKHTIVLNNVNISAEAESAVDIRASEDGEGTLSPAEVMLILKGENTLRSSSEYGQNAFAALRTETEKGTVNPDAEAVSSVVIEATEGGILYAYGGSGTSGGKPGAAAIGSNADGICGKITINSGSIYAYGGNKGGTVSAGGSGAGIGNGGVSDGINSWVFAGTVEINGGNVHAEGGYNAAGIGSGSTLGASAGSEMIISIAGGTINAAGGGDYGAGIGGEFSGLISISGDADVTAEGGSRGGAGIGGSSSYPAGVSYSSVPSDTISISGDAKVTSTGHRGAAGIGGGFNAGVLGTISISGNTSVTAVSEGYASLINSMSGAGIGAGCLSSSMEAGGNIVITDSAVVYAYTEGNGANAVGIGTPSSISDRADEADIVTSITLGQNITLAAFVADTSSAAVPQKNIPLDFVFSSSKYKEAPVSFSMNPDSLIFFTLEDGNDYPAEDVRHEATSGSYQWEYNNSLHTLKVSDSSFTWDQNYMASLGNWAVVIPAAPESGYKVTYDAGGASGEVPAPGTYQEGDEVTVAAPDNLRKDGFVFKGWCDSAAGIMYQPGDKFSMPARNVTLTAVWEAVCPADMVSVLFCVNGCEYVRVQVEKGNSLGVLMPADPEISGCSFTGWFLPDGSIFTESSVVSCSITVYAGWQAVSSC